MIVRVVVVVGARVVVGMPAVVVLGHAWGGYVFMYAPTHAPTHAPTTDPATDPALPTGEQARAAAEVLRLLADPTRLRLLAVLAAADRDVTELTQLTGVPRPAVSQHLSRLRLGGLVVAHPRGRRRIYTVRNGHVRRLVTETLAHADHLVSGLPDHE